MPNASSCKDIAFGDLERELETTRRVLERLPEAHYAWKPHVKSMSLGDLAAHVANLLTWQSSILQTDEFDLGAPPPPIRGPANREELLRRFEENAAAVRRALEQTDDAALVRPWTLRHGAQVLFTWPKATVMRVMGLSHLLHHRGQLCVYLRLLDVPVPAVYGPSADEPRF
jgi:uncharacterized damage-inducible protein DinB